MSPIITFIGRVTRRRAAGVLLSYLLLLAAFGVLLALLVPLLADQFGALASSD